MRVLYVKCALPTSTRTHLRLPWIRGRAACGLHSGGPGGWNLVDTLGSDVWPAELCGRCQRHRRTFWPELWARGSRIHPARLEELVGPLEVCSPPYHRLDCAGGCQVAP